MVVSVPVVTIARNSIVSIYRFIRWETSGLILRISQLVLLLTILQLNSLLFTPALESQQESVCDQHGLPVSILEMTKQLQKHVQISSCPLVSRDAGFQTQTMAWGPHSHENEITLRVAEIRCLLTYHLTPRTYWLHSEKPSENLLMCSISSIMPQKKRLHLRFFQLMLALDFFGILSPKRWWGSLVGPCGTGRRLHTAVPHLLCIKLIISLQWMIHCFKLQTRSPTLSLLTWQRTGMADRPTLATSQLWNSCLWCLQGSRS